ncbi:MAG: hypothetical protein A3K90_04620 [Pelodictyon luteolum]|uniref:Thiamine phosphate synthase/TenI domain-containing protein n=1 Tax=Pelodictyon luteolum TaxID=1100 RepID=A0A165M2C2_PELLU|nr:thiamine phosphate synthase [Pelodictyon luteolum]KZK74732.1 MAG: hypothetical protein A3K90_04620 [Pelodictyon luteolum]
MKASTTSSAPLPRIAVISSGTTPGQEGNRTESLLRGLAEAPPCMILIREKHLQGGKLFSLARDARELPLPAGSRLLVSERIDIALAGGLDGVHLPEEACSLHLLRQAAPSLIFGRSVHSLRDAVAAAEAGADYLFFSPVYSTPSKLAFGPPQGTEKLREACRAVSIPVYALGGISVERAKECMECGAWGIAAISLFSDSTDLPSTIETLYRTIA